MSYLNSLGVDPSKDVVSIVATHWHDDHIRGMANLVETCNEATFCCSSALCEEEFLTMIAAVEGRHMSKTGSGMREFYTTFELLKNRPNKLKRALVDRVIYNKNNCQIWSLSPSDLDFSLFLQNVGQLIPSDNETKRRIQPLSPNRAAVVLLILINETAVLLGSDLERPGWLQVLEADGRPNCRASVFKVAHHGSKNAHEIRIWKELLNKTPIALLTPWQRGGKELPSKEDISRILQLADKAYITSTSQSFVSKPKRTRDRAVERTIQNSGAVLKSVNLSPGKIRLRKISDSQTLWSIETFGKACELKDYYRQVQK